MPTREVDPRFWADYHRLTRAQQEQFVRAALRLAEDLERGGPIRASLRVKPMRNNPGIWELTWDGQDGRATFTFGPEQLPGKRHVIWRRVGGHAIFEQP